MNQSAIARSAIAVIPSRRTLAMRSVQRSGVPTRAAVLAMIRLRSRRGWWTPSHIAGQAADEMPQTCAVAAPAASSTWTASRPRSSIVYSPGGTDDPPWPRAS